MGDGSSFGVNTCNKKRGISTSNGNHTQSIAHQVGNAHELNPYEATGRNLQTSFLTLAKADETIDLLNNVIGRAIGDATKGESMQSRALATLEYFRQTGLWTATSVTNEKGVITGFTISQTKLNTEQYNNALKTLKSTNNNGYTPEQQAKRNLEIKKNTADGEKMQKEINSKREPKI